MKIINNKDMPQGSEEWLKVRKGYGMASEVGALLGVSKWEPKTPLELYRVKNGEKEIKMNFAMAHGNQYEDVARQMFQDDMGAKWEPVVVLSEVGSVPVGASLDGYREEDNSILEIKCPLKGVKSDLWIELSDTDRIPEQYWLQCQQQLLVTQSDKLYFYVYDTDRGAGLMKIIKPYPKAQASIVEAWQRHWDVQPPLATASDVIENTDAIWEDTAREWKEVSIALSELKAQEASLKKSLIELSKGQSMKAAGVQIKISEAKGRVNYNNIPELKGVDLEKYRGEPTVKHYLKIMDERIHA